jgi:hypothetical protein
MRNPMRRTCCPSVHLFQSFASTHHRGSFKYDLLQRPTSTQASQSMSTAKNEAFIGEAPSDDYSSYSQPDLISRITHLESQLRATQSQLTTLISRTGTRPPSTPPKNSAIYTLHSPQICLPRLSLQRLRACQQQCHTEANGGRSTLQGLAQGATHIA